MTISNQISREELVLMYEFAACQLVAAQEELAKLKKHYRVPTHGACCTCQVCGNDYDTCRCTLDEVADKLTEAQEENRKLKESLEFLRTTISDVY
jgi:hypothetical protein